MDSERKDLQQKAESYICSVVTGLGNFLGIRPASEISSKSEQQRAKVHSPLRETIAKILGTAPAGRARPIPRTASILDAKLFGQSIGQILGTEPLDRVQSAMNEEIAPESPRLEDASGKELEAQSASKPKQQGAKGKKPLYKDGEGKLYYRASPNWTAEQKAKFRL